LFREAGARLLSAVAAWHNPPTYLGDYTEWDASEQLRSSCALCGSFHGTYNAAHSPNFLGGICSRGTLRSRMEIQLMRRVREIFERNGRRVDFKFLRRPFIYEIRLELAVREQDHSPASCWLRGASPRNLLGCKRRGLCKNNVRVNPIFRKCVRHLRKISHIVLGDFVSRLAFADRQANAIPVETFFRE